MVWKSTLFRVGGTDQTQAIDGEGSGRCLPYVVFWFDCRNSNTTDRTLLLQIYSSVAQKEAKGVLLEEP